MCPLKIFEFRGQKKSTINLRARQPKWCEALVPLSEAWGVAVAEQLTGGWKFDFIFLLSDF